jgi:site-specific DNA recombinase
LKFARDNNLNIIKIREEIVSGESLIHRPEMLELLKEVEQELYNGVLVMDMQRLGRGDLQDQGLILNTFRISNTKIITPKKTYDLNDEFDEEYSEFEAFMSRKEYKMITRRMQGGRIRSVQEGNYIGTRPPFGYELEETKHHRTLKPHPEQAEIVKLIFDMYINGTGSRNIAAHLNSIGSRSYTGIPWGNSSVLNLLKNPVYMGKVVWKKKCIRKSTTPGKKKDTYTRKKEDWIVSDGLHPALVPEDVFNQAQAILEGKYHVPYQLVNGMKNPLAGLVLCKTCGKKMLYRPVNCREPRFMCPDGCGNISTKFKYVEKKLIALLEDWLNKRELELKTRGRQPAANHAAVYKSNLESLEKELVGLNQQKLKIHDLLEKEVYSVEMFLERSQSIADRIDSLNSGIRKARAQYERELQRQLYKDNILPQIRKALEVYWDLDVYEKNEVLKNILEKVEYLRTEQDDEESFLITIFPKLPAI